MSSNTYTVKTRAVSGGRTTSGTGASASAGGIAPTTSGVTEHSELSGRGLSDQHPMSAVTGLAEFRALFESMFERVDVDADNWYIRAKKDFASMGGLTAYALNPDLTTHLYDLGDVPSYAGRTDKFLKVNANGILEWAPVAEPQSAAWGNIGGELSTQTDLANALAGKQDTVSDLSAIRTNAYNGNTAYGWGNHASEGYLTSISKAMVETVLTGHISSHTHSYLPLGGGQMAGVLQMNGNRIRCNSLTVHNDLLNDTSHGLTAFSISNPSGSQVSYLGILSVNEYYRFQIGSGGGGGNRLWYRGYDNNNGKWCDWVTLHHTGNLTSLSQLTDNLGSNPVHTHSQYLTSTAAQTTYHPKGGSIGLSMNAASLTLAGEIRGATGITASGNGNFGGASVSGDVSVGVRNNGRHIRLLASHNGGVYDNDTSSWIIGTDGTNSWLSQGNVGIGTASPTSKLDVIGTLRASGAVTVGSTLNVADTVTAKEMVLSNNGHTLRMELDSDGNLIINGNVLATGGVTAYQTA